MVRIAAATISALPLGTWASTLRRKCTRQRCQAAPSSTAAIAAFSPVWASEMTSCTPARPRAFSERRNAVQNAPSSLSPTAKPSTSRRPSAAHAGGDHDRLGDHPAVRPGPCSRWRRGTRRGTACSASERSRNAATSASRSAQIRETSDLEIPVSAPSALTRSSTLRVRDAVQVGLHHHREQRLIDPAAPLQQRREERPGAQLRDPQLQIPGRGRQRPGPVPVALRRCGSRCARAGRRRSPRSARPRSTPDRSSRPPDRIRSSTSAAFSASSTSSRADWSRAIVCVSFREILGGSRRASHDGPSYVISHAERGPGLTPPAGTSPWVCGPLAAGTAARGQAGCAVPSANFNVGQPPRVG